MSTHNICFHAEIRKINTFWLKKVPYLELWSTAGSLLIFFECVICVIIHIDETYRIYPKYWDTLSTYHDCPKI